MEPTIRPGRPDDLSHIAAFTRDSFSWGDYVPDSFLAWLDDPEGLVMVAVDAEDRPLGLARVVMLSPVEAWLHAARVHPDVRRRGVGLALNEHGVAWARARGALVARLAIEDWNEAPRGQVQRLGFRAVAHWAHASLELADEAPDPRQNGGRRPPPEERLALAPGAEATPAWMVWFGSGLAAAAHRLHPLGWHFRTMTLEDVVTAARRRRLWYCPAGWLIAKAEDDEWRVSWISTTESDASRLLDALRDRARRSGARRIHAMVPRLPWLRDALETSGFSSAASTVWAKAL